MTLNWPKLKKKSPPSAAVLKYKMQWWGLYIIAQHGCKLSNKHHGSSFSCTDNEYLVRSGGSVHLHDAKSGKSSEFLTNDKFVSLLPHNTRCQRTDYTQTHALSSVWLRAQQQIMFLPCSGWKKCFWLLSVRGPAICRFHEQLRQGTLNMHSQLFKDKDG